MITIELSKFRRIVSLTKAATPRTANYPSNPLSNVVIELSGNTLTAVAADKYWIARYTTTADGPCDVGPLYYHAAELRDVGRLCKTPVVELAEGSVGGFPVGSVALEAGYPSKVYQLLNDCVDADPLPEPPMITYDALATLAAIAPAKKDRVPRSVLTFSRASERFIYVTDGAGLEVVLPG